MSDDILPFTPLIIIGAGRSGTNILRDTLTSLEGFETWPCDEINPIWRHGNLFWPNDEIPADRATPAIRKFIRYQFIKYWKASGRPKYVVEKTCANTLRVPFVDAVLPEARYINLVRDGYDVVASAQKRWQGDFELPKGSYFLSKARYTPIRDLPVYGYKFLQARLKMKAGKSEHLGIWGPRFEGMDQMTDTPLIDLCALQWAACIERSDAAYAAMTPERVAHITYERFMSEPMDVLNGILDTVASPDQPFTDETLTKAIAGIRAPSPGKRAKVAPLLSDPVRERLDGIMTRKGYEL